MSTGPDMLTLDHLGKYSAMYERGEIDQEKLTWAKCNACPGCGACQFIGTASTMQIMSEALGLALPGIALITDGRFSGASTGPVIGHCSPEAADGGTMALVEEDDLIEIDVVARKLNIVGVAGERKSPEEIDAILKERRKMWHPREPKYRRGVLRLFAEHATSPMRGAWLDYDDTNTNK